jgi:hypothetical protein
MNEYKFILLFLVLNMTVFFQLSLSHTDISSQTESSNLSKLTFKRIVFHGLGSNLERFGNGLSEIGDVNNDGYDDFVIGQITRGIASLFFGRPSNQWESSYSRADANVSLKTVINTSFCESDTYPDDWCFTAPALGGDFNGDSYEDFIIMNSGWGNTENSDKGAAMVYLGRSSDQWKESSSSLYPNTTFIGETNGDKAGHGATGVGDVNNDGFDDLIIGAFKNNEGGNEAGQTYLILGSSSFEWNGQYSLSLANASFIGEASGDESGSWISQAGDVNKDGFDDFIIGAVEEENSADANRKVHLIFGRPTEQWQKDMPVSQDNVTFISGDPSGNVGLSWRWLSGAGDVNNDGFSDFIFGDYRNEKTYLILGRPTEEWQSNYSFSASNGSFVGVEDEFRWSGFCVAGVGDTNGDEHDDFLIGAFQNQPYPHLGKGYLILGRSSDQWTQNMPLNQSDASFKGDNYQDWFGFDLSGAGDVDNNGLDDFLIGAPGNIFAAGTTGKAYLFLSEIINITSPTSPTSAPTTTAEEAPTSSETSTSPSEPASTSLGCFGVLVALSLPFLLKKRKNNY